jgi:hypothetical protein
MDPQHHAELGQAGRVWEPPLEVGQAGHGDHSGLSLLTALGLAFLTFNSGMAIYRSNGDYESIAFVAFSYFDLVLLFYCLRYYEQGDRRSKWVKAAVWVLTTLLTVMFSYKVAAVMPLKVAAIVWAMAGTTVLGGHYAFFVHKEKERP